MNWVVLWQWSIPASIQNYTGPIGSCGSMPQIHSPFKTPMHGCSVEISQFTPRSALDMHKVPQTPRRSLHSLRTTALPGAFQLDAVWGVADIYNDRIQRAGMWSVARHVEWDDHLPFTFLLCWVSFHLTTWQPASVLRGPNLTSTYLSAKECEHSSEVTSRNEFLSSGMGLTGLHLSPSGQRPAAMWGRLVQWKLLGLLSHWLRNPGM